MDVPEISTDEGPKVTTCWRGISQMLGCFGYGSGASGAAQIVCR